MIIYILNRGCFFQLCTCIATYILMEVNQTGLFHCLGSKATCSLYKNKYPEYEILHYLPQYNICEQIKL